MEINKVLQSKIADVDFDHLEFGKTFSDHMLIAEYENGEWGTPKIIPYGEISLSPSLSSLHYGQSIFEGFKVYSVSDNIRAFRAEDHFLRFNKSAERMCMPHIPKSIFIDGLKAVVKLDKEWIPKRESDSLYIRPVMFATENYLGVRRSNKYLFVIITCPISSYFDGQISAKIELKYSRSVLGGYGYAKSAGNYSGSLYASELAKEEGFNQVIWTDALTHSRIEEGSAMNVFFNFDNILVTPALDHGTILSGITRDTIIKLARDMGITVIERDVYVKEIIEAIDKGTLLEVFGVGTAAVITSVNQIGYNENRYDIKNDTAVSKKILLELQKIILGKVEDNNNWIMKI
jgi:branched-chain amino acid aminotransferase